MMKANSPICVRENPASMATFRFWPVTSIPKVPSSIMPKITTPDSTRIGAQYCVMMCGSTIMPTDMKNTDPNRSFTGVTTRSIRSAKLVPARIEPITNAPNASENPQQTEKTAMPRHSPIDMIRSVSEFR